MQSNLAQASGSPDELYVARVKDRKILLENPLRESKQRKERQEKKEKQALVKAKRKRGLVGKKEARQKEIWKFDESQAKCAALLLSCQWLSLAYHGQCRYHFFVPLHHLWMGYMSELLGLPKPSHLPMEKAMPSSVGMHPKLVKADFHGSLLRGTSICSLVNFKRLRLCRTVHKSKNPSLVNQAGIVIVETENTFKVITKENKVKGRSIPPLNEYLSIQSPTLL